MPFDKLREQVLLDIHQMLRNKNLYVDEGDDNSSEDEPDTEAMKNKNLDHRKLKPNNKKVEPEKTYRVYT